MPSMASSASRVAAEVHEESRIGDLNYFDAINIFDSFDDLFAMSARD